MPYGGYCAVCRLATLIFFVFVVGSCYFGQVDTCEHECDAEHDNSHYGIRNRNIAVIARKEETAYNHRGKDAAEAVERLCQIETARSSRLVAKFGGIGIGRCFEHCQSATYNEQRKEKHGKRHAHRSGNKQKRTDAEKQQTHYHSAAVAVSRDYETGRKRHKKISEICSGLNERGLCDRYAERLLKMLVEHIKNSACKSPHKEKRGDEYEGEGEFLAYESTHCWLLSEVLVMYVLQN